MAAKICKDKHLFTNTTDPPCMQCSADIRLLPNLIPKLHTYTKVAGFFVFFTLIKIKHVPKKLMVFAGMDNNALTLSSLLNLLSFLKMDTDWFSISAVWSSVNLPTFQLAQ